jgi:transcription elongation factor
MFEGNRYVDGFLIKTMPMTSLMIEGIKPTLDEITLFEGSVDLAAAADIETEVW